MKQIKVTVLDNREAVIDGKTYSSGQRVEVDEATADFLIAHGAVSAPKGYTPPEAADRAPDGGDAGPAESDAAKEGAKA